MNQENTTNITIIRHGETEWNKMGIQQGHLDSNLTSLGVKQALSLAKSLSKNKFDFLYSSDLGRALDTAKIISKKLKLEIITEKRLRERKLGIMQGQTIKEFEQKNPAEYLKFISSDAEASVKDGESKKDVYIRTTQCLLELSRKHPGKSIVLVTHGGVIDRIFRFIFNIPLDAKRNFSLYNASINSFIFKNDTFFLKTWGDVSHLKKIGTNDDF
jgi:2,3-bisphosphoglycerate-dependent phosphoglycerate mutase